MNIIKMYGGLGNQMFQYAFGKAMENNGIKVEYEMSFYDRPQDPPRPYCLPYFHTRVRRGQLNRNFITIRETADLFYGCDLSYLTRDNCNFNGYWQNVNYFKSVFLKLREEFVIREELYTSAYEKLREKILAENSLSLHVRRGDYIAINGHCIIPMDYYNKALEIMKEKGYEHLYIFSDDLPWCKEHFSGNVTFVDLDEIFCLELMGLCKNNIVANSTFSWWAAMLNRNPQKIVIAPERWRERQGEQQALDTGEFVNKEWIRL